MVRRPGFAVALAFYELDLISRDGDLGKVDQWRAFAEEEGVRLSFQKPSLPRKRSGTRGGRGRGRGGRRRRPNRNRGPKSPPGIDPSAPEAGAWSPPPE